MKSIPPWFMWGTSVTLSVPPASSQPTQQLARVDFDRPAAWAFLIFAELGQPVSTPNTDVVFNFLLGLGRSQQTIAAKLRVAYGAGPAGLPGTAWTQSILSNGVVDPVTDAVVSQPVEVLTASNIQCSATILNAPITGIQSITVGAYFTPWAHARAEWYADIKQAIASGRHR